MTVDSVVLLVAWLDEEGDWLLCCLRVPAHTFTDYLSVVVFDGWLFTDT